MNKELFKNYADIKNQIKELTVKAKEMEGVVTEEMNKNNVEEVKSDFGTFFFKTLKKWAYSEEVRDKEVEVKELKKKEEETNIAKFEESKSLSFRTNNK